MQRLTDTSPEAREVQLSVLRRMGPRRRFELTMQWSQFVRQTAMAGIRDRHPEYSDRQVLLAFARKTLGEKLFREAFGEEADLIRD